VNFHQEVLPNGLTLLAESNAHALSTGLGFFVKTGSRDEAAEIAGVSHFLEHMAFKGNDVHSGDDINRRFDEMGAKYNAYTTEEHTVYHAVVLPEFVEETAGLLAALLRPALRADDFAMEQKVIVEEIGMYADLPSFAAYEYAMTRHFNGHPLGNSVLGTERTVGGLTPEAMRDYHARHYGPESVVVAGAGNLDWDRFRATIVKHCGDWKRAARPARARPTYRPGPNLLVHVERFNQECLFGLAPAPAATHPLRAAAELLAVILADDTGSRFYWELVEPGKVETVDFGFNEYYGAGAYMLSAACTPDAMPECLEVARRILADVTAHGVTEAELQTAKTKSAARLVLAAEKPRNRLGPLGYNWCYRETYRTVASELEEIAAVTERDVRALLDEFPPLPATTVGVGPLKQLADLEIAA
jgi:predicted Zn-dependent peptidase